MKLSIVIVNYNVKYFLEQCLLSVRKAVSGIEAELFVVDNNSVDGSCAMVKERFPEVILIENKDNTGFSRANNQAILKSKGEYILLLNPDTLVEEDSFSKVVDFMDTTPDAGGVGVKMIDGNGVFLPESKRGLPTPTVAFYKIFGLSKFFPNSKNFGKYHLTYLDKDKIHEVEVLSGACMFLRRKALDKIGLLDETFFMYGEDIDLSYRIVLGGYKNYYFPQTTIIHYKGESTKKGSINYVFVFYNAMVIFANKHFSTRNANLFSILIKTAIWFRASLALLSRFLMKMFLPILDFMFLYFGYNTIATFWERYKFPSGGGFPDDLLLYFRFGYIAVWMMSVFFSSGYNSKIQIGTVIRGLTLGTIFILLVYSVLPESLRFSRAMIFFGYLWALVSVVSLRFILHFIRFSGFSFDFKKSLRIVIVGFEDEAARITEILNRAEFIPFVVGNVYPEDNMASKEKGYIGSVSQLPDIIKVNRVDELVFCAKDLPSWKIISTMLSLSVLDVKFKIAPPESFSIIGSNNINTIDDLYVIEIDSIAKMHNRLIKRFFDIASAVILLLSAPFLIFVVKSKKSFFRNILDVLFAKKTWVGYDRSSLNYLDLPVLLPGVLSPTDNFSEKTKGHRSVNRLNIEYAKNYSVLNDFYILMKSIRKLE